MSVLDLNSKEAISFTNNCCYIKEKKYLPLDRNYQIYLFFDLVPYSYLTQLKQARLILFKLPRAHMEKQIDNMYCEYCIAPLIDFFTIYSSMYNNLFVDYSKVVIFQDRIHCSYIEVDITNIVKAWVKEDLENKGLLLNGCYNSPSILFAANKYDIKGMRPRLRLIYEENVFNKALSIVPCTVKI